MLDWVMQAVQDEQSTGYPQETNPYAIRVWCDFSSKAVDKNKLIHNLSKWLESMLSVRAVEHLGIAWEELSDTAKRPPLKTSVSSLVKKNVLHDPLPLTSSEEEEEDKRQPEEIVSPLRLSDLPARPSFMEEKQLTGAQRGTMVHHVLSLIDLKALGDHLDESLWQELRRLETLGCVTPEESNVINHGSLVRFYQSAIGQRMLRSQEVRREWGFNLRMEGDTLLQGVIDCAFKENDSWVLVDYKTDYITDEDAFIQRYAMQLEWYARALERITGVAVKEMWLYALGKGNAYQVPRQ